MQVVCTTVQHLLALLSQTGRRGRIFFWTHFRLSLETAMHLRMRRAIPSVYYVEGVKHSAAPTSWDQWVRGSGGRIAQDCAASHD